MKLTTREGHTIQLEEVYNEVVLVSKTFDEFSICMRDSGFEFFYGGRKFEANDGILVDLGRIYKD